MSDSREMQDDCQARRVNRQLQATLPGESGETTVRLPLGGVASSDAAKVHAPLVRPFWLLAGALAGAIGVFVWSRLALF